MDEKIQTSQQKAGEHSLTEGKDSGEATVDSRTDEQTPSGDPLQTSQQKSGELSLSES